MQATRLIFAVLLVGCLFSASHATTGKLPVIPEVILGVNQYSVGRPADLAKYWPLKDDEATYLKGIGINTVKFPLYPAEVGVDEKKLIAWNTGDKFDPSQLKPDWRALDAVIDYMIRNQLTPFICPSPEISGDWSTKTWMSLHVPENAVRSVWFTKLVVDHVTEKYGDNVIYGWYENWWWNSYKHEKSAEFPAAFRKKLSQMYSDRIADLNKAWGTSYKSFSDVQIPRIFVNGSIPEEAIDSRSSYDLLRAIDLMHRDVLTDLRRHIKKIAPKAMWAGGCCLNEIGGMTDIRSCTVPRCSASLRTCAATGDVLSVDLYAPKFLYHSYYRLSAKIAVAEGKPFFVVECPSIYPEAFGWIADVGGHSAGVVAWSGKEDGFGFIKWDGTRREDNAQKFKEFAEAFVADRARYGKYKPGSIRVYFPEETLYYSLTASNHTDAWMHVCDYMKPDELEPVLTDELAKLPKDAHIFVLEKTMPRRAIQALAKLGDRVICPHSYFVDEYGDKHHRTAPNDFYARLKSVPDGDKLLDAFQRVEEKENNVSLKYSGATVSSPTELAAANLVIAGRENDLANLIDGNINEGITFSDKQQVEKVVIRLNQGRTIYGAFVQLFAGDGQMTGPSPLPQQVKITVSEDGVNYTEPKDITGVSPAMRNHIRFTPIRARYICFDFGENTRSSGLKIEEVGVIGERR